MQTSRKSGSGNDRLKILNSQTTRKVTTPPATIENMLFAIGDDIG